LHEGGEDGEFRSQALKEFVYKVVKEFAEENQKFYQVSNLIDLMNKVVNERRGEIFSEPEEVLGAADSTTRSNQRAKANQTNSLFMNRSQGKK